jgi:transcriptional regulator with XRE-family HTH domain
MGKHAAHFGQRIREIRLSQQLTIEQLSERIGKSHNFMGNIERGESTPAIQTLIDIANALHVGTDTILRDYLTISNANVKSSYADSIIGKLQTLSDAEQKDIWVMMELMLHFKNIPHSE